MSDKQPAVKTAPKRHGPKTETLECILAGKYNAIGLPVVPHTVVTVSDAGKGKLEWRLIGQQVIGSRRFAPPVVVEYITTAEHAKWTQAKLDAEAREAARK